MRLIATNSLITETTQQLTNSIGCINEIIMKNLHVLPSPNPSRLQLQMNGKFHIDNGKTIALRSNVNIYITSDEKLPYSSEIFHTGAFYHKDFGGDVHIINKDTYYPNPNFCSRIILTTDESLFKYGVQPIDDEFLEWICKNPSCEEVEVKPLLSNNGRALFGYKIIIPKEEAKQETLEEYFLGKMKEVLLFKNDALAIRFIEKYYQAKKEQERSYSEEEVKKLIVDFLFTKGIGREVGSVNNWFEQLKKK